MADRNQDVSTLLVNATDYYKSGKYGQALDTFMYALRKAPDNEKAIQLFYSVCLKKMQDPRAQGGVMSKLFKKASSYTKALAAAQGAFAARRFEPAMEQAARGLWDEPRNAQLLEIAAKSAGEAGYFNAACFLIDTAHIVSPKDTGILKNAVRIFRAAEDYDKAAQFAEELIRISPNDEEASKLAHNMAAERAIHKGKYEEEGDFRKSIKDVEKQKKLYEETRSVHGEREIGVAIERYKERIRAEPDKVGHYIQIGDLYRKADKFRSARLAYDEGLRREPNNFLLMARIGDLEIELQRIKIDEVQKQLDADPEDKELKNTLESLEAEKLQKELGESGKRIRAHPTDMSLQLTHGRLLMEAGRINDAIKHLQSARREVRCRLEAITLLGGCYMSKGFPDMAADQFREALESLEVMTDEKKNVLYQYARALEQMGDEEKALKQYKIIHAEDISYRDVAEKVEAFYSKKRARREETGSRETEEES